MLPASHFACRVFPLRSIHFCLFSSVTYTIYGYTLHWAARHGDTGVHPPFGTEPFGMEVFVGIFGGWNFFRLETSITRIIFTFVYY